MLYDISLPLDGTTPTYPGDPELRLESYTKPSGTQLTKIAMGSHTGTHIDAPSHSIANAESIGGFVLEDFYGAARVIDVPARIDVESLE